jgi:hypothetical protein
VYLDMRNALAAWFNAVGNGSSDAGRIARAVICYKIAAKLAPHWSVPYFNLGLRAKESGQWRDSLRFNQRASELDPEDEASWWNLAIAATALHNWPEARRGWRRFGLEVEEGLDEVRTPKMRACVRLNPEGSGEVVWGLRLDPARIMIENVPLPESNRRFNDIVLNDGAPNGTRTSNGDEFPVFDELSVWKPSSYSTFEVTILHPNEESRGRLESLCAVREVGLEDWSTLRHLCAQCSAGNPSPHSCISQEAINGNRYGFAAHHRDEVGDILEEWSSQTPGAEYSEIRLGLLATS